MWSKSLGVKLIVGCAFCGAAMADPADEAFRARDFARAERIWQEQAAQGSADAMLDLGLLYDLGLGVPRDTATALRWYLEAAERGLAEAQFNVAVMLDSGVGGREEASAAAAWYSRAAANGHARARYNLGLLYEAGEGVPVNLDLARYWLDLAAPDVPAAAERLQTLGVAQTEDLLGPVVLTGAVSGNRAELAWTSAPSVGDFVVELVSDGRVIADHWTDASAVSLDVGDGADLWWRVSRVGANDYAASDWQHLRGNGPAPAGRMRISGSVAGFAQDIAADLAASGMVIAASGPTDADVTRVVYRYERDSALAREIAGFLPAMEPDEADRDAGAMLLPGEVSVSVIGGPS